MSSLNLILIGGDYQKESEAIVGPLARICLEKFSVDKVFIGVDGFKPESGFTCVNLLRAEVSNFMSSRANKVIIVTDSSKFDKVGVANFLMPEDIDILITDKDIPDSNLETLKKAEVEVILV